MKDSVTSGLSSREQNVGAKGVVLVGSQHYI